MAKLIDKAKRKFHEIKNSKKTDNQNTDSKNKDEKKKLKAQVVPVYRLVWNNYQKFYLIKKIWFQSFNFKFRFATKLDLFMMFISVLGAIGNGILTPLLLIVFTNIIDSFSVSGRDLCT